MSESKVFNETADVTFGSICCLCFVIGTVGNSISFLYYRSKKKDIANVIYMMITLNDIIISLSVLPVGISFLTKRRPGLLFGNKYSCMLWWYLWEIAVVFSVFLVLCMSITRTHSLLRPFKRLKIKYLLIVVAVYLVLQLAVLIVGYHYSLLGQIGFDPGQGRCVMSLHKTDTLVLFLILEVGVDLTYVAPAFVVAISSVLSAVLLTRSNQQIGQKEVRATRNKATVTILLFAVVYGVCNVPLIFIYIVQSYCVYTESWRWFGSLFKFDTLGYFFNASFTLLIAVNSATNPALYFWRMHRLREFTLSGIRMILSGQNPASRRNTVTSMGGGFGGRSSIVSSHLVNEYTPGRKSVFSHEAAECTQRRRTIISSHVPTDYTSRRRSVFSRVGSTESTTGRLVSYHVATEYTPDKISVSKN